MANSLSFFLSSRYVKSRQGNGFASFISASSTIGIGLGVLVLIVVLSAMNGFEKALAKHLLSVVPHAELISVRDAIDDWQKYAQLVEQQPNVSAVAPVIKFQGMLQKRDQLKGVELRGVDVKLEQQVSSLTDFIEQGRWQHLIQENAIIVGAGIAKKLKLSLGDKVQVLLPNNDKQQNLAKRFAAPIKKQLEVVAIFKFGGLIDDSQAYISLAQAQQIAGLEQQQVQGLRLVVEDVFNAPIIASRAASNLDHYLYIYDWKRQHGNLFNDIQLVRMVMYIVLILVIAVASFNIVSTLIMIVNDKKGDIAILKTMGASDSSIMLTFIIQGLVNGVVGCIVGGALGVFLALNLTDIIVWLENMMQVKFLSSDIYFIDFLPSELLVSDVISTLLIALCLSFFATLYPAWRATKIAPAQILGQL